jgi:hypothetical protein
LGDEKVSGCLIKNKGHWIEIGIGVNLFNAPLGTSISI